MVIHKGQGHMDFFGAFLCALHCGYRRTVLSLEQGLALLCKRFIAVWSGMRL